MCRDSWATTRTDRQYLAVEDMTVRLPQWDPGARCPIRVGSSVFAAAARDPTRPSGRSAPDAFSNALTIRVVEPAARWAEGLVEHRQVARIKSGAFQPSR